MTQAKRIIENWRIEYNTERPHSSLGKLTPAGFAMQSRRKTEEALSLTADSNSGPY
jgi:putative transposase